jgi:RNA polymerase sigma factor (sigma-70 family)
MDATAIKTLGPTGLTGPTPLLRVASDERLVTLTRGGNQGAFETLVGRYQSRLLSFCRHMLSSKEDAEDVLQEVFAAAFNALLADDRPVNVRPWLYRIARNRCLNHLRKRSAIGVDSMDIHLADYGTSTADRVHQREDFRMLMSDVQTLPETQRTALLLREIDALSYDQIAEAMDTTVPSVKSLLVRARVSLAEAAEARLLTCEEVREELGLIAEGLATMSPPIRRHVKECDRCAAFRKHLKNNNKQLAAIFPLGPLLLLKKFLLAQGVSSASAAGTAATSSGAVSAGIGTVASKAAAGMAAAAIVTAGAVEVDHAQQTRAERPNTPVLASTVRPAPAPQVVDHEVQVTPRKRTRLEPKTVAAPATTTAPAPPVVTQTTPQQAEDATSLPPQTTTPETPTVPTTPTTPTEPPAPPPVVPVDPPVIPPSTPLTAPTDPIPPSTP